MLTTEGKITLHGGPCDGKVREAPSGLHPAHVRASPSYKEVRYNPVPFSVRLPTGSKITVYEWLHEWGDCTPASGPLHEKGAIAAALDILLRLSILLSPQPAGQKRMDMSEESRGYVGEYLRKSLEGWSVDVYTKPPLPPSQGGALYVRGEHRSGGLVFGPMRVRHDAIESTTTTRKEFSDEVLDAMQRATREYFQDESGTSETSASSSDAEPHTCSTCEYWREGVAPAGNSDMGVCTRMKQSKGEMTRALVFEDSDESVDTGVAYPYDKRADLMTHKDFGCVLHSELERGRDDQCDGEAPDRGRDDRGDSVEFMVPEWVIDELEGARAEAEESSEDYPSGSPDQRLYSGKVSAYEHALNLLSGYTQVNET